MKVRHVLAHAAALSIALGSTAMARAEGEEGSSTTWLPGKARAIVRTDSASRDAAVFEIAYGPRAQSSIGAELGVVESRGTSTTLRFGAYGLIGLENAVSHQLFPASELWRDLAGLSLALELPRAARAWLPAGSLLELGLVLGYEGDHATNGSTLDMPSQRAIPFGAGGDFLAPDVAVRLPLGRAAQVSLRLTDRIYLNALPLVAGARTASDAVADYLHEGLANAATADLVLRWRATRCVEPQLALYAEHLFARDAFVADGALFRAMGGLVLPGRAGEVEPFASFDAGNGKGLLDDRREARFSIGVRYAPF